MSWSVGEFNGRDIGYGVPAMCDHPGCGAEINRGIAQVCGGEVYGGESGCGLFFCDKHRRSMQFEESDGGLHWRSVCERCRQFFPAFDPTPDVQEWIDHKETDPSWAEWRASRSKPPAASRLKP